MHLMSYDSFSLRLNAITPNTSFYSEWNRVEAFFGRHCQFGPPLFGGLGFSIGWGPSVVCGGPQHLHRGIHLSCSRMPL